MKEFFKNVLYFIYDLFTEHPESNGESYVVHMYMALKISLICLLASFFLIIGSCLVHYALDVCDRKKNITKGCWQHGDDDDLW